MSVKLTPTGTATMAINRFLGWLAAILRETVELRARSWRDEACTAGWVAAPELAAPCSCCHRRALKPVTPQATNGRAAVHFCPDCDRLGAPMLTSG